MSIVVRPGDDEKVGGMKGKKEGYVGCVVNDAMMMNCVVEVGWRAEVYFSQGRGWK